MPDHLVQKTLIEHINHVTSLLKIPTYSLVLKIKPAHHSMAYRSGRIKLPFRVLAQHPGFPLDSPVHSAAFTSAQATLSTENPPSPHAHTHLANLCSSLSDLSFKVVSSGPCPPLLLLRYYTLIPGETLHLFSLIAGLQVLPC